MSGAPLSRDYRLRHGLRVRQALIAAMILGYALMVQYSNGATASPGLGAALAVAPVLAIVLMLARRARRQWIALPLALLAVSALLWALWADLERHFAWIYLLQQCAAYAALALAFGRTLLPGQTPLCTRWATLLHGALAEDALRYTRAVTAVWSGFFAAIVLLCAALYFLAARTTWSLFSNFMVLPLAALLFAAEYALRRRCLPRMQRASLAAMMRIYLADTHHASRS